MLFMNIIILVGSDGEIVQNNYYKPFEYVF